MFKIFTKKGRCKHKILVANLALPFYLWCEVFKKTERGLIYTTDVPMEWDHKNISKVINVEDFLY